MNENERARIAAAVNQLRPDWPVASLMTMLNSAKMKDRPRRDVAVALAWVACESETQTPARVLEHGPWWVAAAQDSDGPTRWMPPKAEDACKHHPGEWRDKCRCCAANVLAGRPPHEGENDWMRRPYKPTPELLQETREAIKVSGQEGATAEAEARAAREATTHQRAQARDADRRAREVASEGSAVA